jgi:hypothetical protein
MIVQNTPFFQENARQTYANIIEPKTECQPSRQTDMHGDATLDLWYVH